MYICTIPSVSVVPVWFTDIPLNVTDAPLNSPYRLDVIYTGILFEHVYTRSFVFASL